MADQVVVFAGRYTGDFIREDVLDVIYQITPEDTPFFNMIGDSQANNVVHEWTTRALATRAVNAVAEGDEFSLAEFEDPVLPTRVRNFCQILRKLPRVTETAQATNSIGITDLMADQIQQRMVEFKTDVEHALLRGSLNSGPATGGSTTPRQMDGFHNAVTSNGTDLLSNTSLAEALFNDLLQDIWVDGGKAQDVLVNGALKRIISGYTDSSTKFIMAEDRRIINTIAVYESDFHTTSIHLSRDVQDGQGVADVYAFDRSFFAKSWLRTPKVERLAKVGDDQRAALYGEVTLEYGNEQAAGKIENAQRF